MANPGDAESSQLAEDKSEKKKRTISGKRENTVAKKNFKKKEKRNIIGFLLEKDIDLSSKVKKIKCKICLQIFQAFRKNENFKNFKKFAKIEKSLFSNSYEKLSKMVAEIREIFNEYFSALAVDALNYPKIFSLFSHFENIYKDYESRKFINETKNILEIKKKMNKLQKIVKHNRYGNANNNITNRDSSRVWRFDEKGSFYAYESNREKRISNKFKLELLNNIKALNTEKIRGMLKLLQDSDNRFDAQNANSVELDINKLSANKIKELDKYVRRCFLETKNKELRNINFHDSGLNVNDYSNKKNGNKNLNLNSELNLSNINNEKCFQDKAGGCYDSDNYLLGKKHNRSFFDSNNNRDSELFYREDNKNNNFYSNKSNKICIANNTLPQNSFTNAETPNSNINKSKFDRGNSLEIDFDPESEESSDEESYSDLEIGKFRI